MTLSRPEDHAWLTQQLEYHMNSPPLCLRFLDHHTSLTERKVFESHKTIKKQTGQKKFELWLAKQVTQHLEESVHHGSKEEHAILPCGFTAGEAGLWYLRGQLGVQKPDGKTKKKKERMAWDLVYAGSSNYQTQQKRLFEAIQAHVVDQSSLSWEKFSNKFRENWFKKSLFQQKLSLRKRLEAFFKWLRLPTDTLPQIITQYFKP